MYWGKLKIPDLYDDINHSLESRGFSCPGGGAGVDHRSAQISSTSAAFRPVVGNHRSSGASCQTQAAHQLQLRIRVGGESVDGDNSRHSKLLDVLDMMDQVRATRLSKECLFLHIYLAS